jgi:uncharacterized delta-60 repeat protein
VHRKSSTHLAPGRGSLSEGGFFSPRALVTLVVLFAGIALALFAKANPRAFTHEYANQSAKAYFGPLGDVQQAWVAHYDGPGDYEDRVKGLTTDNSGNVYVTGVSWGSGTGPDYATIKYNSTGQEQWVARYNGPLGFGDDAAAAIAVDTSGNVYVTGESMNLNSHQDYTTIKYNSAGQEQWVARYSGPGNFDEAAAIAIDSSGNVYVTGSSEDSDFRDDIVTVKYNAAGQQQWVARYNGPASDEDEAIGIALDDSGNVFVAGSSVGTTYPDYDYTTIKYSSAGQEEWVARYNGPGEGVDFVTGMAIDGAANTYVTGASTGPNGDYDYATIKYDSSGQEQWVEHYDGPGNGDDSPSGIALDSSGNVYVTGSSTGANASSDYATVKYNPAGLRQWIARYYNPETNNDDFARAIAVDSSDNVYVTGTSWVLGGGDDYVTLKYNSAGEEQWGAHYTEISGPSAVAIAVDTSGNVWVAGWGGFYPDFHYITLMYTQGGTPTPTPTASPTPTPRTTPRLRPTPHPRPTPP